MFYGNCINWLSIYFGIIYALSPCYDLHASYDPYHWQHRLDQHCIGTNLLALKIWLPSHL